jgi:hypothetical protein
VEMIEERHRRHKEEIKNNISHKINNERLKYCESLDKFMIQKREEELLRQEKAFKKYQHFVNNNIYLFLYSISA